MTVKAQIPLAKISGKQPAASHSRKLPSARKQAATREQPLVALVNRKPRSAVRVALEEPTPVPQPVTPVLALQLPSVPRVQTASVREWPVPSAAPAQVAPETQVQRGFTLLARAWSWLQAKRAQSAGKRLRVAELVSLGEKRFVALITLDNQQFLIGGGTSGISLLAHIETEQEFSHVLSHKLAIE